MTGMQFDEGGVNPNQSMQVEDKFWREHIPFHFPSIHHDYHDEGGVPFHLGSIILTGDIIIFVWASRSDIYL